MSLGTLLFNDGQVDVRVGPSIQFITVKADALHTNAELPHVRSDGFVEFCAAHAEVGGSCIGSQESGWAGDKASGYLF
jgi:hypothetical protein